MLKDKKYSILKVKSWEDRWDILCIKEFRMDFTFINGKLRDLLR